MSKPAKAAQIAKLRPVRMEVGTGEPGYRWVDGFQVIQPDGTEVFPYMRKRVAREFCKAQGWKVRIEA